MWNTFLRRILFFPFAAIYAVIILVRNVLFDCGWLKSTPAKRPTIVIGNVTVGGTGKTPHAIYLLSFLVEHGHKAAFLSRGYGRSTKGFVDFKSSSSASQIGDEPAIIAQRFPNLPGAVCEKRVEGTNRMVNLYPEIDLFVLDDAYQHRQLKGDLYILTTDYSRPFFNDFMLPAGSLRDNRREYRRAQIILVTKCPDDISESDKQRFLKGLNPLSHQLVCFTSYTYGKPKNLKGQEANFSGATPVIGFSGLAVNKPFEIYLKKHFSLKKFKDYSDHHLYSEGDMVLLEKELSTFDLPQGVLITTEKDAVKWKSGKGALNESLYFLPIDVRFIDGEKEFWHRIEQFLKNRK